MTASEHDQDVMQWGLQVLDFFNSHYGPYCSQEDASNPSMYRGNCMTDYSCNTEYDSACNYAEDNAIIQHNLPEEFSQLEVDNAAEPSQPDAEEFHISIVASDWLVPSTVNYFPAQEDAQEEANDIGYTSSCSSPGDISYDGENYSYYLELTDDPALDGELGRRLNQMVPVPHVPKINGEIPTMDEATTDHQRLLDRLQLYNLAERKVQGDGNCQFRALSDQFYRSPEHHKFVRQQVVHQLKSHPESYEGYVPMEYGEYLQKMSRSGEWGDHVTLQAIADLYGVKIFLITSFKDTCYMEIIPKVQKSNRVISLSFWAEVHYNSIYPQGEVPPPCEMKKKKRWWHLKKQPITETDLSSCAL